MRILYPVALALLLSACTVGPDYAGPPPIGADGTAPAAFARRDAASDTAQPALGSWWTALRDPVLDELETRALAANPDIAIAEARLRQARAGLRLERANQLPSGNASTTYLHAQLPGLDLGGTSGNDAGSDGSSDGSSALNFYNVGFDASWEIDLFGGQRRTVEAARADLAAAQANIADAQVSLTAEVAQAYVNLRDRQRRIALARQAADRQRQMLDLTRQRFARGTASALEVERLGAQVENADADLLPLGAELDGYRNALAVLTGAAPGAVDALLDSPAPLPLPPASVPVGDPAALLQRRPDIRAAERRLAAETARIGVAEAARFPRLNLLGLIGIGGTDPSDLVDLGNLTALAAPMLQWNLLDFGRTGARIEQARGTRDEAEATYRKAVLAALRDAEDALSRFGHRRANVASLARSAASAARASALTQQRYEAGTATRIDALDAERQRLSAEQALTAASAQMTGDFIALQKALGLGWQAPAGSDAVP